jgi:enamine deaminase RidA (YjgF/YER057c/UK114 family)
MNNENFINKRTFIFLSEKGNSVKEQLDNCLSNLTEKLVNLNIDSHNILKQTIFLKAKSNEQFLEKKEILQKILEKHFFKTIPPISIISQAPANGKEIAMEVICALNTENNIIIENKSIENTNYKVVRSGDYVEVFACGLTSFDISNDIKRQSEIAFKKMNAILINENLNFSSVIRQWNYIENIYVASKSNGKLTQNYQIFNDVRSKYYNGEKFDNGYPAATGIGMDVGGVIINFIASSSSKHISIHSVNNPLQIDAHKYNKDVLIGETDNEKSSPKFERAKTVSNHILGDIYISGTAAIKGQETIEQNEIIAQTITTIENIKELITVDNLKNNGIEVFNNSVTMSSLRVYLKNKHDFHKAKELCEQYFPNVSTLYLIADICRDNLIVEIEGKANF